MPPETTQPRTIVIVNGSPDHCLFFADEATATAWIWANSYRFSTLELYCGKRTFASGAAAAPYAYSKAMQER